MCRSRCFTVADPGFSEWEGVLFGQGGRVSHLHKNDTEPDISHGCCNESTWNVIQTSETVLHSP